MLPRLVGVQRACELLFTGELFSGKQGADMGLFLRAVPADEVLVGDRLVIKPGERFPVDGILLEGPTQVDESMLTGEPVAVAREVGVGYATLCRALGPAAAGDPKPPSAGASEVP